METNETTYSSAIRELEEIVTEIESGEVDVDVLTVKVKRFGAYQILQGQP